MIGESVTDFGGHAGPTPPTIRGGRVLLLTLGGTISMQSRRPGDPIQPALGAAKRTGRLGSEHVDSRELARVPGASLHWADLGVLIDAVRDAARDGYTGVVVTQGTSTLEEVAFMTGVAHAEIGIGVVFTGGMRGADHVGADGPSNIADAIVVARDTAASCHGVLVTVGNEIHAARYVRKSNTFVPAALSSSPGMVGWVAEGTPRWCLSPPPLATMPVQARFDRDAPIVTSALADTADLLQELAERPLDGLVVQAFGVGHVSADHAEVLGGIAAQIPVVLASRTGAGRTATSTYGFTGSEHDLLARGLIHAGILDAYKARIVVALLRSGGATREQASAYLNDNFTHITMKADT